MIIPAIASAGTVFFLRQYITSSMPMILISTPDKMTLPVMMTTLRASTNINNNQSAIYLTVAISVIPILLVFACFSKYIISSVTAGAVKE